MRSQKGQKFSFFKKIYVAKSKNRLYATVPEMQTRYNAVLWEVNFINGTNKARFQSHCD